MLNIGRSDDEVYVNWDENEPKTENEFEHCVQFGPIKKTYIVDSCKEKFSFICKKNASTIERNEYCDSYDRSWYKIYNNININNYEIEQKNPTQITGLPQ